MHFESIQRGIPGCGLMGQFEVIKVVRQDVQMVDVQMVDFIQSDTIQGRLIRSVLEQGLMKLKNLLWA